MWNSKKSLELTLALVRALFVIFIGIAVAAPFLAKWFCEIGNREPIDYYVFIATFYVCCPSAAVTLINLNKFLVLIKSENVFSAECVKRLRILSWACFSAVPLSIPLCFFFIGAMPIPAAAAFMGLFLRVIKNCFEKGEELKAENDLTV